MILVWGFKSYVQLLGVVTFVCGNCHNPAAQRVSERIRKFTLFWIPLFTTKRQTIVTCTFCGAGSILTKEQAATLMAQMPGGQAAPSTMPEQLPASDH